MDNDDHSQKTSRRASVASLFTVAVLVVASFASIGMMQANHVSASSDIVFKEQIKDVSVGVENATSVEGNIATVVFPFATVTSSGEEIITLGIIKYDLSTDTVIFAFFGFGPADQLKVNGLRSATFSGTITGTESFTGEEMTVTVNVDLTATGKPQTFRFQTREVIGGQFVQIIKTNEIGKFVHASGSVNVSGDLNFSIDDASGIIGNFRSGEIIVQKF